jgi:hypothetical protein
MSGGAVAAVTDPRESGVPWGCSSQELLPSIFLQLFLVKMSLLGPKSGLFSIGRSATDVQNRHKTRFAPQMRDRLWLERGSIACNYHTIEGC